MGLFGVCICLMYCVISLNDVMLWAGHLVGSGPSGRRLS